MAFQLRTFIRVREPDKEESKAALCVDLNPERTAISIRDLAQRFQTVSFNFPKIFIDESQETVYKTLFPEEILREALKGKNAGVISYGQSGAGKTYTQFGPEKVDLLSVEKGLIQRLAHDLYRIITSEGLKIEASVCFFEIYVDEVRDLAKLFAEEQGEARGRGLSSTEELKIKQMSFHRQSTFGADIYETGEGDAEIKGMSRVYLKSENDVLALLRSGFGIRRSLEKKKPSIGQRVHTVFVLRLEEAGLGSKAGKLISKIYFVDLAGSERYAKSAGDSEKYREATSISNELKSLERAFMALPNEGILPKETLLISTIKGLLQQNTNVTLVGHIIGTTVNFFDKFGNFSKKAKKIGCRNIRKL